MRRSHIKACGLGDLRDVRRRPEPGAGAVFGRQSFQAPPLREQPLEATPIETEHQRQKRNRRLGQRLPNASPDHTKDLMCAGPAVYCVRLSMDTSRILTVRALPLLSTSRWMTDPGPDAETVLRNWFQRRTGLPFSFLITSPGRSPL